jgi:hypothetical protein
MLQRYNRPKAGQAMTPCTHPDARRISCGREFIWCAQCGAMRRIAPTYLWQLPDHFRPKAQKKTGKRC